MCIALLSLSLGLMTTEVLGQGMQLAGVNATVPGGLATRQSVAAEIPEPPCIRWTNAA